MKQSEMLYAYLCDHCGWQDSKSVDYNSVRCPECGCRAHKHATYPCDFCLREAAKILGTAA